MRPPHPIIIAAFGTTSRAREIYSHVDQGLKERFPLHEIHWAYSSRIVSDRMKKRNIDQPTPADILEMLAAKGHDWAVVQSFNMICGHEFQRLRDSVQNSAIRVSIGHSLLCSAADMADAATALAPIFAKSPGEAVVFVGHGTDHCAWSTYLAFEKMLRKHYGDRAFVGIVEGHWPDKEAVVAELVAKKFERVRLVPCMLVAGVHFAEDLVGEEDSWKTTLQAQGLEVLLEKEGLGGRPGIIDIFADHIRQALDVIPG